MSFSIFNDSSYAVSDVDIGVRRRGEATGGRKLAWHTAQIRAGSQASVSEVDIPPDMFVGLHESAATQEAFVFLVHFNDHRGERWEAWRDGATGQGDWLFHPPPLES